MQKPMLLVLVGAIILSAAITGFLFLRGNEDTWVCEQGKWIAHGHPSSAQPTSGCVEEQTAGMPTEATLPKVPNKYFGPAEAKPFVCETQKSVDKVILPLLTKITATWKSVPCGECGKPPICVKYVGSEVFTYVDIIYFETKLSLAGATVFMKPTMDEQQKTVELGIQTIIDGKRGNVVLRFYLERQYIIVSADY